jgi:hypothetical protein
LRLRNHEIGITGFQFNENGTMIESDIPEAEKFFLTVREQLSVHRFWRDFFLKDSGIEASGICYFQLLFSDKIISI